MMTDDRYPFRDCLQRAMAEFATPEYLRAIDDEGRYPYEVYDAWVELGLFRIGFPRAYGGVGGDLAELLLVAQDVAYWSHDLYTAYSVSLYAGLRLLKFGSQAQKQQLLPALMAGRVRLSTSVSELTAEPPRTSATGTTATPADGGWLLNGHKLWSSAAGARHNVLQVLARTASEHSAGMSLFLVANDAPGLQTRKFAMLGRRATGSYEVFLDDVFVPRECLVGELQDGWNVLQECRPAERLLGAAGCVGSAQKVVDLAVAHAQERDQPAPVAGEGHLTRHVLADMQTAVDASRLLVERAGVRLGKGRDATREVAMAALFSSDTYAKVAEHGMQVLGRYGQTMENEMQRHFRDARCNSAGGISARRQRDAIASSMGLPPPAACPFALPHGAAPTCPFNPGQGNFSHDPPSLFA